MSCKRRPGTKRKDLFSITINQPRGWGAAAVRKQVWGSIWAAGGKRVWTSEGAAAAWWPRPPRGCCRDSWKQHQRLSRIIQITSELRLLPQRSLPLRTLQVQGFELLLHYIFINWFNQGLVCWISRITVQRGGVTTVNFSWSISNRREKQHVSMRLRRSSKRCSAACLCSFVFSSRFPGRLSCDLQGRLLSFSTSGLLTDTTSAELRSVMSGGGQTPRQLLTTPSCW